jgi:hypothetical protein
LLADIVHFKGEAEGENLRKFGEWYSNDALKATAYSQHPSQAVLRFVFVLQELVSFGDQMRSLAELQRQLKFLLIL